MLLPLANEKENKASNADTEVPAAAWYFCEEVVLSSFFCRSTFVSQSHSHDSRKAPKLRKLILAERMPVYLALCSAAGCK